VDGVTVYKQDIPGLQVIGFPLNMVSCLSREKDNNLVKIVVMIRKFLSGLVLDMKKCRNSWSR